MTDSSRASADEILWKLVPLTPEYLEEEHGGYVRAINTALAEPKIKNIALSGNYGVGKSSILQQVAKNYADKVVEISLSTLAPKVDTEVDDSIPKQATTTTNRIQQEIVKQLLYREEPQKLTGSRFRRIERFYWKREIGIAAILGFVIAVVFLLTGWTDTISNTLMPRIFLGLYEHLAMLVSGALSVISFRWLFHGRLRITQLSAGAATVTLDDKSMSYFDQYLDEIVHFFDVSKRNIVIFEDIDRFDDPHIFETLRALNTLLNAPRSDEHAIRFIYAVKDSIFDIKRLNKLSAESNNDTGPAHAEIFRANRTKFFDLVVPVVPFITHRNAKNLVHRLLDDLPHNISSELLDLASRYVPDMRLLKNVRNEFAIFRERIFSGDGQQLRLSETGLFAIMLYKSTHLSDFEAIRLGNSSLDKLYTLYRNFIAENIRELESKILLNRTKLSSLDGVSETSLQLKERFSQYIQLVGRANSYETKSGNLLFNGKTVTEVELSSVKFWTEFVLEDSEPTIIWRNARYQQTLSFSRSDLEKALNVSLEPDTWNEAGRTQLKVEIEECMDDLKFLRVADMGALMKKDGLIGTYSNSSHTFDTIVRQVLNSELAYQLVKSEFIDRNFTLYTSTFHGDRVSPSAQNFIIHNIERNLIDEYFELSSQDVEAILRECDKECLREPALYNNDILNYLLKFKPDLAIIMLRSLLTMGTAQKRFMRAYLSIGCRPAKFICQLADISPDIFTYLIRDVELGEVKRLKLISVALSSLNTNAKYRTGSLVEEYFAENYLYFPVLISEKVDLQKIKKIAKFFSSICLRVVQLAPLSSFCRKEFIALNLYAINRENIRLVFEEQVNLALDVALNLDTAVYKYLLQNLQNFLFAIDGFSETIGSNANFIRVLEDVLKSDPSMLDEIIANSSESCIVDNIDQISSDAWPNLAKFNRFKPTFSNINRYLEKIGTVDNNLSKVLESTDKIIESASFSEDEKQSVAVKVLAARDTLRTAQLRVSLVSSLNLGDYLDISVLPTEDGELFALLLAGDHISDSVESYMHIASTDWQTRELFIQKSKNFKDYITQDIADGNITDLLTSEKVSVLVKNSIMDRVIEFESVCSKEDFRQIGLTALRLDRTIPISLIMDMPNYGVSDKDVLALLFPHLSAISKTQLFEVLQNMGEDYSLLTSVGREVIKLSDTKETLAVLDVLKQHGIVSRVNHKAGLLYIYRRHK